jgi:hypothetical protein
MKTYANIRTDAETFWNNLPEEDKVKAFYSIMTRLRQGEIKDQGTYRYVLYDIFNFEPYMYSIGIECGYFDIHNMIASANQDASST